MSLRWRITVLVIGLLAAVLLGAGWSLVRVEEREYERELLGRMRHLGFTGVRLVRPRPRGRGMRVEPLDSEEASDVEMEAQPDGAHVEVLCFLGPPDGRLDLAGRASTGTSRIARERAVELLGTLRPDQPSDVEIKGALYYALVPAMSRGRMPGGRGEQGERGGPDEHRGPGGPRTGPRGAPPRPPGDGERWGRGRGPGPLQALVLLERDPPRAVLAARIGRAATIGLLALVLGAALAYLLAGRMLRPVRRAAEAAEAIDSPDQRLPEPGQADELGRLVNVLNGMLGRIEAGATRERTFLATASHELRRPLAALRGEIELALRKERDVEELRQALHRSLGDAKAMGRLVDDLLLHARSRAGAAPLVEVDVDWVDLVTEAVERSRRVLPSGVRVEVLDLPSVVVHGDAMRLGQVVENLVTNAGTHGGPEPHVVIESSFEGEGLTLVVEDDGGGIAAEELASIFEPFGRGDMARSSPGAGLGLAIAQDGVEAHAGRIDVVSPVRADGGGTRFVVQLPASRVRPVR